MTTYRYRVVYHCPDCRADHGRETVIRSLDPALDGRPLVEAYDGNASSPEIVAILGEIIRCPTSQKIVTPELEQFFLAVAR